MLAGGVHDMVVLFCSVRHRGRSLAHIATTEIDKTTGLVAAWAVLAILILTWPVFPSLWSTPCTIRFGLPYTVAATIPIAIIMGLSMQVWRKGDVKGATLIGVVLLFLYLVRSVGCLSS